MGAFDEAKIMTDRLQVRCSIHCATLPPHYSCLHTSLVNFLNMIEKLLPVAIVFDSNVVRNIKNS